MRQPTTPLRLALTLTALTLAAAAIIYATGHDDTITLTLYQPTNSFAWFLREWSNIPVALIILASVIFLATPLVRDTSPALRQHAAVFALVALLGAGLVNQLIIKEAIERPRPRDNLLVNHPITQNLNFSGAYTTPRTTASLTGKSMPSGHAGVAFLLFVPAFVFWPRRRKTALAFLSAGISFGLLVGWARITLGAHYPSDVLVAAAINFLGAGLAAAFVKPHTRIYTFIPLSILLITAATIMVTKHFNTQLTWQGQNVTNPTFNLPCSVQTIPSTPRQTQTLTVNLSGYGLPATWISLKEKNNTFSIQKFGFQRNFSCTATWQSPN